MEYWSSPLGLSTRRTESVPAGGTLRQPEHILVVWREDIQLQSIIIVYWRFGTRIGPLPDFSMSIGEGNSSGAIMVTGWEINDPRCRGVFHHHIGETPCIDAVRMLVQQHVALCRAWIDHIAGFIINSV